MAQNPKRLKFTDADTNAEVAAMIAADREKVVKVVLSVEGKPAIDLSIRVADAWKVSELLDDAINQAEKATGPRVHHHGDPAHPDRWPGDPNPDCTKCGGKGTVISGGKSVDCACCDEIPDPPSV